MLTVAFCSNQCCAEIHSTAISMALDFVVVRLNLHSYTIQWFTNESLNLEISILVFRFSRFKVNGFLGIN